MLKRAVGYISDIDFLGNVDAINYKDEKVLLVNQEGTKEIAEFDEVEFMNEVFVMHDTYIYEKDVLRVKANGDLAVVNKVKDNQISLTVLNSKTLQESDMKSYIFLDKDGLSFLESHYVLEAHVYQLRSMLPKNPEFNIEIVKSYNGAYYTYYYACNDKDNKKIDLIKVIFVGSTLIEEETYERNTVSYDDYQDYVRSGIYESVSPRELQNYALGATYKPNKNSVDIDMDDDMCVDVDEGNKNDTYVYSDSHSEGKEGFCGSYCECDSGEDCKKIISSLMESFQSGEHEVNINPNEDSHVKPKSEDKPESPIKCGECGEDKELCDCRLWN